MWAVVLGLCLLLGTMLVNASIFDSSCSTTIDRSTVKELYSHIVAKASKQLPSEDHNHFNGHYLDEVRIGNMKDSLDVVGDTGMY